MESSEPVEMVPPGRRRTQPAYAESNGAELSTRSVFAVVFLMTVLAYLVAWTNPSVGGLTAWLLADETVNLVLWLGILRMLGWWQASGLARGSVRAGIVLPLAALSLTTVLIVADEGGLPGGAEYWHLIVPHLFLGALREEVAFAASCSTA